MEKLSMCRICLIKDVRMHCLINSNLQEIYELLTGQLLDTTDPRPVHACYVCCARLRNCLQLRSACLHSEELFTHLLDNDDFKIKTIQVKGMLRTVSVIHVSHPVVQTELEPEPEPEPTTDEQLNNQHVGDLEDYIEDQGIYTLQIKQEDIKSEKISSEDDELDYSIGSIKTETKSASDNSCLENDPLERDIQKSDHSISSVNVKDICDKTVNIVLHQVDLNCLEKAATVTKTLTSADLEDTSQSTHLNNTENKEILKPNICTDYKKTVHTSSEIHCGLNNESFKHIHTHTGEKLYKCSTGEIGCNRKRDILDHISTHTGKNKPYKCGTCGKWIISKQSLLRHINIHTGEKRYKCDICGKGFYYKCELPRHIRTHTDEKPYKCGTCGKCFYDKYRLSRHIRTHTGEKPYKCGICGKCFGQKQYLTPHIRTHTGEKPYKCDICGKCFNEKQHLLVHQSVHVSEKLYKCDTCGKCFHRNRQLLRHIRTHTKKPYKCDTCKK